MKKWTRSKSAPVGVVAKVIQILEQLDRFPNGLLLREIVDATGINKSTAYRFLAHLESEGYIFRDSASYYMVGPKLARLGTSATYQAALCRNAAPILSQICKSSQETVNLAILDGNEILYLSVFESQHTFRMASQVGTRRPLYCTALGKAILANLPAEHQKKLVDSIHFQKHTSRTIVTAEALRKELAKIKRRGYAIDDEEAVEGARCIAARIFIEESNVIAGISLSGPTVRVTRAKDSEYSSALRTAATEIASKLAPISS